MSDIKFPRVETPTAAELAAWWNVSTRTTERLLKATRDHDDCPHAGTGHETASIIEI